MAKGYGGIARNLSADQSGGISLNVVTQSGGVISGTFAFHSPLVGTGPFKGSITATSVKFTVEPTAASCPGCTSIVFTGSVSTLVSMAGAWIAHVKSGAPQDGTWELGSVWEGSFQYKGGISGKMTAMNVTENEQGVVGGSVRYSTGGGGALVGTVDGDVIRFTNDCLQSIGCGGNETINYTGKIAPLDGVITGTFTNVTDHGHGTWQLRRNGAASAI